MTQPQDPHNPFSGLSVFARITIAAVVILVIGTCAFFARPAWNVLKHFRAMSFMEKAEGAFSEGNPILALDRARAALQLEPHNPAILLLNARVLTELQSDTCLPLWQFLAHRPGASPDEQMNFVEAALAFHRLDLIGPTYSNLCAAGTESGRLFRLGALYQLGIGTSNAALSKARAAYRIEPSNPTNALLVASLIPASAPASDTEEARSLLLEVARSASTPLRLIALRRLVQTPIGNRADREWVELSLSQSTSRTPAEDVLLAETRIRLDPAITRKTIGELIGRIPHDHTEWLTLVVETLARLEAYEEVVNLTVGNRSLRNRTLFQARYEALVALQQRDEAYRHLLQANAPVPPFELALAKVKSSIDAKDTPRRDAHLVELVRAANGNPARLRSAAEMAEGQGSLEIASDAWNRLEKLPGQSTVALRALQRVADRRGDTWSAREAAQRTLRSGASIPTLKLEIAYYDILLDENLENALTEAQAYVAQYPRDFFARAVVALAHLRLGDPDKARTALLRSIPDEPQPRADALAVLVATYGQNGLPVRAREIAARIPLDRLRPEERALVGPWIAPPTENGKL